MRDGYAAAGLSTTVLPFLHDMPAQMAAADLVVSRAGASTLAELTILGRPMVLVPLPTAADDHQRKNAASLARAGAAEVIDERELTGERLAAVVLAAGRRRAAAPADGGGRPRPRPARRRGPGRRSHRSAGGGAVTCSDGRGTCTSWGWVASA